MNQTTAVPDVALQVAERLRTLAGVAAVVLGGSVARGDADVAAVKRKYVELLPPGSPQFFRVTSFTTFHVEQAVRPLTIALALFGAIAGLAALALVGQALGRQLRGERQERNVMRALGATPWAAAAAAAFGPCLVVLAGSLLAVIGAVAASPLMPIGKVRAVEVAPAIPPRPAAGGATHFVPPVGSHGHRSATLWQFCHARKPQALSNHLATRHAKLSTA